jgi:hypothetical protein
MRLDLVDPLRIVISARGGMDDESFRQVEVPEQEIEVMKRLIELGNEVNSLIRLISIEEVLVHFHFHCHCQDRLCLLQDSVWDIERIFSETRQVMEEHDWHQ